MRKRILGVGGERGLSTMEDIDFSTLAPGRVLMWDGNKYVFANINVGGHIIQKNGENLPQRTKLNFDGNYWNVVDDETNNATKVGLDVIDCGNSII